MALCLSGGGFRATFFHLGVVRALRQQGYLEQVGALFCVSGGSILAAHMVLNWDRYCGGPEEFQSAEREILMLASRDVRGRVLRRSLLTLPSLLLPTAWSTVSKLRRGPTDHLRREYDLLYGSATFADVAERQPSGPELHITATDLITGSLCSFSTQGYHVEGKGPVDHPHGAIPLSLAVAASSAYPPIFPPVPVSREMFGATEDEFSASPHRLTDGGVYDNLGYEKLQCLEARRQTRFGIIVISDASSPFDWRTTSTFFWPVTRSTRSFDILMNRVAENTRAQIRSSTPGRKVIQLSIENRTELGLQAAVQNRLRHIRTDLDRFSHIEVEALVGHGERLATEALKGASPSPDSGRVPLPRLDLTASARVPVERLMRTLDRSQRRKLRIFNPVDWASYAIAAIALAVILSVPYALIEARSRTERVQEALDTASSDEKVQFNRVARQQSRISELEKGLEAARTTIAELQTQVRPPQPVACRHPSHGVERYAKTETIEKSSPWMSGGHSQSQWCATLSDQVRASIQGQSLIKVVKTSESSRSRCPPFNCPEYRYTCALQVQSEPIFLERESPACQAPS